MKQSKLSRALALMLALLLTAALAVPAVALDTDTETGIADGWKGTYDLRIDSASATNSYDLYQVFSGTYNSDSRSLGDVVWGVSVSESSGSAIIAAMQAEKLPTTGTETALSNPFYSANSSEAVNQMTSADDVANLLAVNSAAKYVEAFATIVYSVLSQDDTVDKLTQTNATGKLGTGDQPNSYAFDNLHDGYYLVAQSAGTAVGETSKFIVQVVGNTEVKAKERDTDSGNKAPGITKTVVTDVSGNTEATGDSLTYNMGDTVYYKLESSLVDMSQYSSYTFYFQDTLSKGLTWGEVESVTVGETDILEKSTVGDVTVTNWSVDKSSTDSDGNNIVKITLNDMKQYQSLYAAGNKTITVIYSATLNTSAVVGSAGNKNTANVYFSNNPASPSTAVAKETSAVPKNVYTTGIEIFKAVGSDSSSGSPLAGAQFTLTAAEGSSLNTVLEVVHNFERNVTETDTGKLYYQTSSGRYVTVESHKATAAGDSGLAAREFEFYTLTDGSYTRVLEMPTTGDVYVVETGGTTYTKIDSGTASEVTISDVEYKADDTEITYETWMPTYVQRGENEKTITAAEATGGYVGTVGSNGYLYFEGIKAGTYYLEETKAPSGYDKIQGKVEITISYGDSGWTYELANTSGSDAVSEEQFKLYTNSGPTSDGLMKLIVLNTSKGSLPTTGGMGTTIFYIVGSVLVLCAVVLLVARRRMRAGEK